MGSFKESSILESPSISMSDTRITFWNAPSVWGPEGRAAGLSAAEGLMVRAPAKVATQRYVLEFIGSCVLDAVICAEFIAFRKRISRCRLHSTRAGAAQAP